MPPRTQQALRAQIADLRPAGEAGHKLTARIAPKGDARGRPNGEPLPTSSAGDRLMASLFYRRRGRPPDEAPTGSAGSRLMASLFFTGGAGDRLMASLLPPAPGRAA